MRVSVVDANINANFKSPVSIPVLPASTYYPRLDGVACWRSEFGGGGYLTVDGDGENVGTSASFRTCLFGLPFECLICVCV